MHARTRRRRRDLASAVRKPRAAPARNRPGAADRDPHVMWSCQRTTRDLKCTLMGSLFGWDGESGVGEGGVEFELGIVVQAFARLESDKRKLVEEGKGKKGR
ncbi:hypothetical protein VC83_09060 [Pseudogymnoascus destructans]|uniref:Uncharacterized protein n=1 Tax=Pseudogymnoascus destructans TaxID=655981 RepID=A0A176ZXI0_9PEZI|nr:uncharacterized protein VC83_09060 [Pseudogymnoascus destructans]OAF54598.1 hypothetical protein VC83_09060 [Pseudogymnoascus destructans]